MNRIIAYTDGSASWRTRTGGFGIFITYKETVIEYFKGLKNTSIGRMELLGIIMAMRLVKSKNIPLTIYCDSQYAVNCYSEGLLDKWALTNYYNKKNVDLLLLYKAESAKFTDLKIEWVKGHADTIGNQKADELANKGYKGTSNAEKIEDTQNINDFINIC